MSPRSEAAALLDALAESQMTLTALAQAAREKKDTKAATALAAQARERRNEIAALRRRVHADWGAVAQTAAARVKKANAQLNKILKEADRATTVARRFARALAVAAGVGTLVRKALP